MQRVSRSCHSETLWCILVVTRRRAHSFPILVHGPRDQNARRAQRSESHAKTVLPQKSWFACRCLSSESRVPPKRRHNIVWVRITIKCVLRLAGGGLGVCCLIYRRSGAPSQTRDASRTLHRAGQVSSPARCVGALMSGDRTVSSQRRKYWDGASPTTKKS